MAKTLADLIVVISAKTDKLQAGLNQVQRDTGKMSGAFGTASIAIGNFAAQAAMTIVDKLGNAIQSVTLGAANMSDEILDVAKVTGLTTNEVQKFKLAADMEGKSFENVTSMVKFYSKAMKDARDATAAGSAETNEAAQAFKYLNIDLETFSKLTTGEQLNILLAKIKAITNANDRMTIGQKLLGRGFLESMDIIDTYVTKGDKIAEIVDKFAPTQEQLERSAELKTAYGQLQFVMDSLAIKVSGPLADALIKLTPLIEKTATRFSEWLDNPENIASLEKLITSFSDLITKLIEVSTWFDVINSKSGNLNNPLDISGTLLGDLLGVKKGVTAVAPITKPTPETTATSAVTVSEAELKRQREWWRTNIGTEPSFALGGIVTRPTRALIGESGPEAIIPLSQMGNQGGTVVINMGNFMGDDMALREFTRKVQKVLDEENRRTSTPATKTGYYSAGGHL